MPHDYTGVTDPSIIKEEIVMPSTIETIDRALHEWIENLRIHSTTNKGWKEVPIIWVSSERAFQIKDDKNLRDKKGQLKLPLMTLERTSITKDPTKKGAVPGFFPGRADNKGGSMVIARRIQQDKTAAFVNADTARLRGAHPGTVGPSAGGGGPGQINFKTKKKNRPVVYETISVPVPVYLDINYAINIRAEYQQQINEIITTFITKPYNINYFPIFKDGHRFEAFIQPEFEQGNNNTNLGEEERMQNTTVTINVLGYIMGADKNEDRPKVVKRENAVKVKFPRERTSTEDKVQHADKRGFYKE